MTAAGGRWVSTTTGRHAAIQIASTLCFLECAFCMLSAIALGVPTLGRNGELPLVFIYLVVISVLYGVAGYLLRKQLRRGALFVVAMIVARLATVAAGSGPYINIWVIVDVAILLLLRFNWQHLHDPAPPISNPV